MILHPAEIAYAKINLALHVRRRREDGYHELETVFAFLDVGDAITARPAKAFTLTDSGEFAGAMTGQTCVMPGTIWVSTGTLASARAV